MRLCHFVAAVALLVPCLALHADTLDYSFTGTTFPGCSPSATCASVALEFQLPSDPITSHVDFGFGVGLLSVEQNTTGVAIPLPGTVDFLIGRPTILQISTASGDLYWYPDTLDPLFSGPTPSPTLLTGLYPGVLSFNNTSYSGLLTVTDVGSSPVPEPSSLALLGTGLVGIVAGVRRRVL